MIFTALFKYRCEIGHKKEQGEWNVWITKALQQLANRFPFPKHENRDIWIRCLPHAQYILDFRGCSDDKKAEQDLLEKLGRSYTILGKYRESEQMILQTLNLTENMLGRKHPDTLNSMRNLTRALQNQRKDKESEQMHQQTLELRRKVSGAEHFNVAYSP